MAPVVNCDTGDGDGGTTLKMPLLTVLDSEPFDMTLKCEQLSSSLPSSMLSCALHDAKLQDNDRLSSSCFAELRLDKIDSAALPAEDDDLTSLDWLQDINLLRNISPSQQHQQSMAPVVGESASTFTTIDGSQKENILLYDPKCNTAVKPPYSFSVLIFMAIESSARRRLPVKDIYNWIAEHFPFYRRAPAGWRNSVRHNLSLNKCFRKVEKTLGKGSSWCIDPLFRPNLLQAMRRTPYYPFQQLQMTSFANSPHSAFDDLQVSDCYSDVKPDHEDTLSSVCADDLDVASTLASLRSSQQILISDREQKLRKICAEVNLADMVCVPPPSVDHVYGFDESLVRQAQMDMRVATQDSAASPVDEVYDFGEVYCESESPSVSDSDCCDTSETSSLSWKRPRSAARQTVHLPKMKSSGNDNEEERKRLEGVDALLDLASGVRSKKRRIPISGSLWAKAMSERFRKKEKSKKMKKRKKIGKRKVK